MKVFHEFKLHIEDSVRETLNKYANLLEAESDGPLFSKLVGIAGYIVTGLSKGDRFYVEDHATGKLQELVFNNLTVKRVN